MGPDLELEAKSDGNKDLGMKGNGGLSVDTEDEFTKCESNCEENAVNMDRSIDQPMLPDENQDVEVKDTEFPSAGVNGRAKADCHYSTESSSSSSSSSSFDDTAPETDDAIGSSLFSDSSLLNINAFGELLRIRKKKLTSHWRTFIHPLMWRCKWVELQVRKLQDLALKYDRKLVDIKRNSPVESFNLKSVQFQGENPTDKLMKRKKRRRVEDTTDPASYLSNHPVLSYFDNKNHTAGVPLDKDLDNQEIDHSEVHGERLWLESGIGDNSLEDLLRKIGFLQTHARDLKCRLGKVMTENPGLFTCTNGMGVTVPPNLTISAGSPASPPNNGSRMPVGSSALTSHGEGSYISGVIQGTNQSLQRSAITRMQPNDLLSWPAEDDVLIYDERLRAGMKNYDDLGITMEKPQVMKEELEGSFNKALSESELQTDVQQPLKINSVSGIELETDVRQPLKMRSISKITTPKKKKRKGKQKAGSGKQKP